MHIVLLDPGFPESQREFVRALASVGARVTGVGELPVARLDDELLGWLDGYEEVACVTDESRLLACVQRVLSRRPIDRLEATIESHVLPAARVRAACGIEGTSPETAWLCRDKPSMKLEVREVGIPTARWIEPSTAAEAQEFAAHVGYPVILKPRAAAGAAGTLRADDAGALDRAMSDVANGSVVVEEFIEGEEGTWDALIHEGNVAREFISHYRPGVLDAMRTRWISPQIVATNHVGDPKYEEVRTLARRSVEALGIRSSAVHLEWFRGSNGILFGEIACRPAGARVWDLYSAANDIDLYVDWARLLVHGHTGSDPSSRDAAGLIALRPDRDGHVQWHKGVEEIEREYGEFLMASSFPPIGAPTQQPSAGYLANAWIQMRHPDYDTLCRMLDRVGERVQVLAG